MPTNGNTSRKKPTWHHKRNCYKHNCACVWHGVADADTRIAGVAIGTPIAVHQPDKCVCGRPR